MKAFTVLEGVAAPLLRPNINTDIIIRIERLRDFEGAKLGPYCFESWRYRRDGYLRRPLRNLLCLCLYFAGVPPPRIVRLYG